MGTRFYKTNVAFFVLFYTPAWMEGYSDGDVCLSLCPVVTLEYPSIIQSPPTSTPLNVKERISFQTKCNIILHNGTMWKVYQILFRGVGYSVADKKYAPYM